MDVGGYLRSTFGRVSVCQCDPDTLEVADTRWGLLI